MVKSPVWSQILELTADQWGLVSRAQAEGLGIAWSTLSRLARQGTLERYARGIYRLAGAPEVDHLELRAAWLQLAPAQPAWERTVEAGAVSHRSAATLYGLGELPADVHEFVLSVRRQTRRADVRLHRGRLDRDEWETFSGLPVTRPRRIVNDLLADGEDPEAVGRIVVDALREGVEEPAVLAAAAAAHGARHGFRRGDGFGMLRWLLELAGAPERVAWIERAQRTPSASEA